MATRILLPNGCSMSYSVTPKNWESGGKSLLKRDWQIQYRFYDPDFTKKWKHGKLVPIKGMNVYKNLQERREVTKVILQDEIDKIRAGYNPILRRFVEIHIPDEDCELHENLPFLSAFRIALEKLECSDGHRYEIKCAINRVEKASKKLKLHRTLISELKRRDLKRILEACKLPDGYFNKFRTYISSLFVELIEYECCDVNLVRDIRKKRTIKKQREILSPEHYRIVMDHLEANYYEFWRYSKIFGYSGGRSTELFSVQAKDVDVENQEYTVRIKKGKQYTDVIKVILKEVVPLWRELLELAKPNDYLFSIGLEPGAEQVSSDQISRRWRRLVKKSDKIKDKKGKILKITADFYSLKHSLLDTLPLEAAQQIASHTTSTTTAIYRVNQEKRNREMLKNLEIKM